MSVRSTTVALVLLILMQFPLLPAALASEPVPAIEASRSDTPDSGDRHSRHHHGMRERRHIGPVTFILRHRDALALTPEQVERVEQLRLDASRALIRRSADLRVAELELGALRRADSLDLAEVEQKLHDVERARTDLRLLRIRAAEDAKALLTPEQRATLRTLVEQGRRSPCPHAAPRRSAA